jgi:hypothetical protein
LPYSLAVVAIVACQRADDLRDEPRDRVPWRIVVDGHPIPVRTALAARRGGETVYLTLSSAPDRTCDQLFHDAGISLVSGEVVVSLELAQPAFEPDSASRTVPVAHPRWHLARVSWPGGVSRDIDARGKPLNSTVRMPDDLATRGGELAMRYTSMVVANPSSPNASIAIEGATEVKPCGDRRPLSEPPRVVATIGPRQFPLRGAVVTSDDSGWRLTLASLPIGCPNHDVWESAGDLGIDIITRGGERSLHVFGDAVPVQQHIARERIAAEPEGPVDGSGSLAIALDVSTPEIAIRGRVTATRCPRAP